MVVIFLSIDVWFQLCWVGVQVFGCYRPSLVPSQVWQLWVLGREQFHELVWGWVKRNDCILVKGGDWGFPESHS